MEFGKNSQKIRGGGTDSVSRIDKEPPIYEICVGCGLETDVPRDMPVDCRKNYIHGCGQLCRLCAGQLGLRDHPVGGDPVGGVEGASWPAAKKAKGE